MLSIRPPDPRWIMMRGNLVVCPPVLAELLASLHRTEPFIDFFVKEAGIAVDWNLDEPVCLAPRRSCLSAVRRKSSEKDRCRPSAYSRGLFDRRTRFPSPHSCQHLNVGAYHERQTI